VTPASRLQLEALHTRWQLHASRVEAGRQVARVGATAGTVGMQRWRSASTRDQNDAQARVQASDRVGQASLHQRGLVPVSK
jgi:phage FluMu protein gp41